MPAIPLDSKTFQLYYIFLSIIFQSFNSITSIYSYFFSVCFFVASRQKPLSYRCNIRPSPVPIPNCQATNRPRTRPPTCGSHGPKSREVSGRFIPTLITMVWFYDSIFFIPICFSSWPPSFLWVKVSKSEVDGLFLFHLSLFSVNL